MYTQLIDALSKQVMVLRNDENGSFVPLDKQNPAYRSYLSWVANGNSASQSLINEPPKPFTPTPPKTSAASTTAPSSTAKEGT